MISAQILLWVLLSVVTAIVTYWILTEGKSNYLFVLTIAFSLSFGISTSYIWLQITNGLAAFGWGVVVLPVLFSFMAELLLISFYAYNHKTAVMPRVPKFTSTRTVSMISLGVIFVLAFLLASAYTVPNEASQASISTLGSSNIESLDISEILSADLPETSSNEILIQSSVITPTTIRENAKVGEILDFKVEFSPKTTYVNPVMKVFVQDSDGNLINQNNVLLLSSDKNVAEGLIACDESGIFTLTAIVYDTSISNTVPLASSVHTYTVQDTSSSASTDITLWLFVFWIASFIGLISIALVKRKW